MKQKYTLTTLLLIFTIILLYPSHQCKCYELPSFGNTYEIVEKDIRKIIQERIKKLNWKKILDDAHKRLEKKLKEGINIFGTFDLDYATENRTRKIIIEFTLPYDITDIEGNVIYPAGYTFNPADYITMTMPIAIFDGTDKKQVEWFKQIRDKYRFGIMAIITRGKILDLMSELKQDVFFLTPDIVETFKIEKIPCLIEQVDNYFLVKEVALKKEIEKEEKNGKKNNKN